MSPASLLPLAGAAARAASGAGADRADSVSAMAFLLPAALLLGAVFVALFLRAVHAGQFDDLDDPPERVLRDDDD